MSAKKNNRSTLLALRRRKEMVHQGVTILSSKRTALMREFHGLIPDVTTARKNLSESLEAANLSLFRAEGLEPPASLQSAAAVASGELRLAVSAESVWGVAIPTIGPFDARRNIMGRGSAPFYRSAAVDETAARFEKALNHLVESARQQSRLETVGAALRTTSRRVNALEQKVAPMVAHHIQTIETFLEEQAREEVFRLKRYKAKHRTEPEG